MWCFYPSQEKVLIMQLILYDQLSNPLNTTEGRYVTFKIIGVSFASVGKYVGRCFGRKIHQENFV